jgi:hypothetical protein
MRPLEKQRQLEIRSNQTYIMPLSFLLGSRLAAVVDRTA